MGNPLVVICLEFFHGWPGVMGLRRTTDVKYPSFKPCECSHTCFSSGWLSCFGMQEKCFILSENIKKTCAQGLKFNKVNSMYFIQGFACSMVSLSTGSLALLS